MGWRDHLAQAEETIVLPWVGGKHLRSGGLMWVLDGWLPREHGWYEFTITNYRTALMNKPTDPKPEVLSHTQRGYLVGDLLVLADTSMVYGTIEVLLALCEHVNLIEPGLPRFAQVSVGRTNRDGPLIFKGQEMGCGVEDEVAAAFQDHKSDVDSIKGALPALRTAFRLESWQRDETERRRAELRAKRDAAERQRMLLEQLGDGAGRRAMAKVDFKEAAKAALAVGGAEYLDHRRSVNHGEMVVTYRILDRRFECVCNMNLGIVDAGICLTSHRTGEKGDDRFTLESLPTVVLEAQQKHKLVVFRHVDGDIPAEWGRDDIDPDDEDW